MSGFLFVPFLGKILYGLYCHLWHKNKFYFTETVRQIGMVGLRAIPVVMLLNLLVGIVLAHQGINTLNDYGQSERIAEIFSPVYVRYVGCLISSLIVAGRSGSAFTAEIGSMVLGQEIDALRSMKVDPIAIIVIPRVLATVLMLPLLVVIAIISGLLGGLLISWFLIEIAPEYFMLNVQNTTKTLTFMSTIYKSIIFGFIIALIGCYRGFCVKNSAQVLGDMTTTSVVECIFWVVVADGLISTYYSFLGI